MPNPNCKACGGSGFQRIIDSEVSECCESCNAPPEAALGRAIIQAIWDKYFLDTLGPKKGST